MNSGLLSFDDALARLLAAAEPVAEVETVSSLDADGRVLAADLLATIDVPPLDNSSMDGYALRCADLDTAEELTVAQRIPAGSLGYTLAPGTAARIFTGAPLPPGADAVAMQEVCSLVGDRLRLDQRPRPGEWIRRRGEDIANGQVVLAAGTRLGPAQLGLAAAVGAATLSVRRRLKVALLSTGDELAMPGEALKPGGIYNSNRHTLHSLLTRLGCLVTDYGVAPDQLEATRGLLREAARDHDLILTSGGVSVGEEDHVKPAVEAEGHLALWKIAIKPGKPLAFGQVRKLGAGEAAQGTATAAFIGLPGNPVSSFVTFLMLVRPFILKAQGATAATPRGLRLRVGFAWRGDARREFLRARLNAEGELELFPNQSSGVLTSCTWADGLIDNPAGQAIAVGDMLRFVPFSELL